MKDLLKTLNGELPWLVKLYVLGGLLSMGIGWIAVFYFFHLLLNRILTEPELKWAAIFGVSYTVNQICVNLFQIWRATKE